MLLKRQPVTQVPIPFDGLGAAGGAISGLGSSINLVFGGSGIVPAAILAIVLNLLIPKSHEDHAEEEAAAHIAELKA